jgi:hypothetical protein
MMASSEDSATLPPSPHVDIIRCRRCASAPSRDQLKLFDADGVAGPRHRSVVRATGASEADGHWPFVETSYSGRIGFWRERTPGIFGNRSGVGPLIILPDTNILISLREQLDEVDFSAAIVLGPRWSDLARPVDGLRDLVQLWLWRDVRFWVSDLHLADAPGPLGPERRLAREAAVGELQQDFFERGGFEPVVSDQIDGDEPCAIHAIPFPRPTGASAISSERRWPRGQRDRNLLEAAFEAPCDVFLTNDKEVLRFHDSFIAEGLAILTPRLLLEALGVARELDDTADPSNALFPDLSVLTRLYSGFG